jgi:hypothetical protein
VLWNHPWIGGTVVDERGEPVEYATVGVMRRSSRAGQPSLTSPSMESCPRLLKNVPPGKYRIAADALPPDVWLDAEVLSTLVERSEPALVESSRPLVIDLATP